MLAKMLSQGFERCGAAEKRTRERNRGKNKRQKNYLMLLITGCALYT